MTTNISGAGPWTKLNFLVPDWSLHPLWLSRGDHLSPAELWPPQDREEGRAVWFTAHGAEKVTSTKNCSRRLPPAACGDLSWNSARTMGLTFQALAKMGPRIFIFIRFPLQLHSNANKPQNNESHQGHFSSWGAISMPHTFCWPYLTEVLKSRVWLLTSPLRWMGERHYDCPVKAVETHTKKGSKARYAQDK